MNCSLTNKQRSLGIRCKSMYCEECKEYFKKEEIINFFDVKSIPIYYELEKSGIKNNTVRFTDDWNNSKWKSYKFSTHLRTTNTETKEVFISKIRHKCEYKNVVIITTGELK